MPPALQVIMRRAILFLGLLPLFLELLFGAIAAIRNSA
jgi:hypothetical protein